MPKWRWGIRCIQREGAHDLVARNVDRESEDDQRNAQHRYEHAAFDVEELGHLPVRAKMPAPIMTPVPIDTAPTSDRLLPLYSAFTASSPEVRSIPGAGRGLSSVRRHRSWAWDEVCGQLHARGRQNQQLSNRHEAHTEPR